MVENKRLQKLLSADSETVARMVLGWKLYVQEDDGSLTGGIITETEAYNQEDAASHSYRGKTPRTEIMFGPAGYAYVYFSYGMHWCLNIVTGKEGVGEAVLIRALLPDLGLPTMHRRRGPVSEKMLTNGPAKLCQALGVSGKDNGLQFGKSRLLLEPSKLPSSYSINATERIGITKDKHRLWRFVALPRSI